MTRNIFKRVDIYFLLYKVSLPRNNFSYYRAYFISSQKVSQFLMDRDLLAAKLGHEKNVQSNLVVSVYFKWETQR